MSRPLSIAPIVRTAERLVALVRQDTIDMIVLTRALDASVARSKATRFYTERR